MCFFKAASNAKFESHESHLYGFFLHVLILCVYLDLLLNQITNVTLKLLYSLMKCGDMIVQCIFGYKKEVTNITMKGFLLS